MLKTKMQDQSTGKAIGKYILIGDHVVLYGYEALCMPMLDAETVVSLKVAKNDKVVCPKGISKKITEALKQDLKTVKSWFKDCKNLNFEVQVEFGVPIGIGAGMSASWSVALIRAFLNLLNVEANHVELYEMAQELEIGHHGKSSGIDLKTIIWRTPVAVLEGLFNKRETAALDLVLVNTGTPKEITKDMVELVAKKVEKNPEILSEFDQLYKMDVKDPYEFMDQFGQALERLGVVSSSVCDAFSDLRKKGGKVKISGAGGLHGGSGLCLVYHQDKKIIKDWIKKYSFAKIA